ncbi:MAG: hypothetical protein J7K98_00435 [Candidatus Aenigmarchaeota archaeon]|nr:hypothetical protein [Candidatus Aenigmarchaeota archaeon]
MECVLRLEVKSPKLIKEALLPEAKREKSAEVKIRVGKKTITIKIRTQKISYLKAIINSYLALINMLESVDEVVG